MSTYKSSKEAFVSGTMGSTVLHINMVSSVALASVALHSSIRSRLYSSIPFYTEFIILVLPLLLSMTLFANTPGWLSFIILVPTAALMFRPSREFGTPLPSASPTSPTRAPQSFRSTSNLPSVIPPLPTLTTYRAHMLLMTFLCILAVDFPVFPRFLAKCETFGVSLMDLGVGSFVFSQGTVSAIPILKDPSYLIAPMTPKIFVIIRKSFPIAVLGLVRVLLVKGTEYPEHETEYGRHWNFFITLAILPILQVLLHPLIKRVPVSLLGIVLALGHQMSLSFLGMERFVLTAPRTNPLSANKEGIVSLTGYMAIHLLGLSTGTLILPPSPSYFRRRQQTSRRSGHNQLDASSQPSNRPLDPSTNIDRPIMGRRQNDKTATELISYAVVWWSLMGLTRFIGVGEGVSRRMTNLSYILWVAAFNTSFISGYLLLDIWFFPSPYAKPKTSANLQVEPDAAGAVNCYSLTEQQKSQNAPELFQAINKNGLVLFLLANAATGLVNLAIPTMYTADVWAMGLLGGYACGLCAAAWLMRNQRVW